MKIAKAWTKHKIGLEHLGKLAGSPDQDPRGKWKATVRRVADDMDTHASRVSNKTIADGIRSAAQTLRNLIPND